MTELSDDQRHVLPLKEGGVKYAFMIVDDSEFMVNNLKRVILGFEGEVLTTAVDGTDAVQKYAALAVKPDLITMDITMPNMTGVEALAAILKMNPAQKIVMVSALGHKEAVQEAIMKGAKHFIVKPFQRNDVYKVVCSVLERK